VIFDPTTGTLWTSDGAFLKHLYCPKAVRWDELGVTRQEPAESYEGARERSRGCTHCSSKVTSLEGLSDDQAAAIFRKERNACVYLRTDWINVTVLRPAATVWGWAEKPPRWSTPDGRIPGHEATLTKTMSARVDDTTPRVHTARTLEQMNAGAAQGYRVLLKATPNPREPSELGYDLEVWQDQESGEVRACVDLRTRPGGYDGRQMTRPWHKVLELRQVYPNEHTSPFAAYLVPRDLTPGTLVLLTDPIEDIVAIKHWGAYRAKLVPATWTGTELDVHVRDVVLPFVVG
jgi:hypothetical protein